MSANAKGDPLQEILCWIANESDSLDFLMSGDYDPEPEDAMREFDRLRRAWLDAGCPGIDQGPRMPPPPRTRVRIAVVQRGAEWAAVGWGGTRDGTLRDRGDRGRVNAAITHLEGAQDGPQCVHFVEADVPAPIESTWEGRVKS